MSGRGEINAWKCPCGKLTVAVHVDDGVTPMFLGCRAQDGCKADRAVSSGYPPPPIPQDILDKLAWEWFRPTGRAYRRLSPDMKAHVDMGGLEIRPLTDAGRAALAERAA